MCKVIITCNFTVMFEDYNNVHCLLLSFTMSAIKRSFDIFKFIKQLF